MSIKFYKTTDEYGAFSNFSRYGFVLDEEYWATSEHYFQTQKFPDMEPKKRIQNAKTSMETAQAVGFDVAGGLLLNLLQNKNLRLSLINGGNGERAIAL